MIKKSRAAESTEKDDLQLVGFRVGDEEYAVNILDVVGIERVEGVLHLPRMPEFIEGVMRIRGEVVPLVKLRRRFGLDEGVSDGQTRVVVIDAKDQTVGFIVDQVTAVRRSTRAHLDPAPEMSLTVESRFVKGVLHLDEGPMILLDPYQILFEDETRKIGRASAVARHYAASGDRPPGGIEGKKAHAAG